MKEKKENLDFEISFFERILADNPTFVECLMALGDAYTKKGLYEKGLQMDQRLVELVPDQETVRYNLACDFSLLSRADEALAELEQALKLGYDEFRYMCEDPDLAFVRQDKRFRTLVQKYAPKKRSRTKQT